MIEGLGLQHHEKWILRCYELAQKAESAGDHPFGSLLVKGEQVLVESVNSVVSDCDVSAHAELNLVRQVTRDYSREDLFDMTLYSSTEPCAMCVGAIYWAGIKTIVYGVSARALAELVGEKFVWPSSELLARAGNQFSVHGPILSEQGMAIHRRFWV